MTSDSMHEIDSLVSQLIDGELSSQQAARLQALLQQSPSAVARYHELLDNHEALCAIYPGDVYADSLSTDPGASDPVAYESSTVTVFAPWTASAKWWAMAATLLIAVGWLGYLLGAGRSPKNPGQDPTAMANTIDVEPSLRSPNNEQTIAGHATLRRSVDLKWPDSSKTYREGDLLPDGRLQFDQGVAEVDFFCGATLIIEGPATLDIESDWSVRVIEGRLRANVPPAARGFVVKTNQSDIVDLGTEFALEVGPESARVEVIDGEIKLQRGPLDGQHLLTGEKRTLSGGNESGGNDHGIESLSTPGQLQDRRQDAAAQRLAQWKVASTQLADDPRLIAYFARLKSLDRRVPNVAASGNEVDGILIGPVEPSLGRFGNEVAGLKFGRLGSRVRTRIDGQFGAYTFACWAKIDSLDHLYNALFMADGYENGEPHWQIHNDGRLMFSVMVDDSQTRQHYSKAEDRVVKTAGLARVYYSEPFWDLSKSGQWFHLVSVYDPANRRVTQYVDAKQMGDQKIADEYFIDELKIGPAEIGNWGQPFRKTPAFSVRNLNGVIDELAIFGAALNETEIQSLYEQGKPLGYE